MGLYTDLNLYQALHIRVDQKNLRYQAPEVLAVGQSGSRLYRAISLVVGGFSTNAAVII